jgi:hypothetical protein
VLSGGSEQVRRDGGVWERGGLQVSDGLFAVCGNIQALPENVAGVSPARAGDGLEQLVDAAIVGAPKRDTALAGGESQTDSV